MHNYKRRRLSQLLLRLLFTMRTLSIGLITVFILIISVRIKADIRRECRKQTGVSWAALKKLRAADFQQNDQKLKCYVKCFMKANGIFEDEDVDIEKALRHLPRSVQGQAKTILEGCRKISSKNSCDKAFRLVECYYRAEPKILTSVSFV